MNSTRLTHALLIAGIAVSMATFASAAESQSTNELIRACKAEAAQGHIRHLTTQKQAIDEHKQRMIDHCQASQSVVTEDREKFLRSCRKEAAWGARSHDRPHMLRQQRLCEKLAGNP